MTQDLVAITDLGDTRPDVRGFGYDRAAVTPGIAHIGVGNFFRVHEAIYVDDCLHRPGQSDWGIIGIGLTNSASGQAKAAAFAAQDHLYTVTVQAADGEPQTRVIGAMIDYLHAPGDPGRVLDLLASPAIRIVSLTVTEGGYNIDEVTGEFDLQNPDVQHDLGSPEAPVTVFGYLTEALRRRRDAGTAPFTVVSCDNLRSNGDTTRKALVGFATAVDPDLGAWVDARVAFPNSMVDRIAPTIPAAVAQSVRDRTGIDDAVPVTTEPFTQWVMEDRFPAGRPDLDQVGAELRDDVAAFEAVKGRMLNASHMLLVYPSLLAGHRLVDRAMAEPDTVELIRQFLRRDVIPTVQAPPGLVPEDYAESAIVRFANPSIGDQLERIAGDGASKLPTFHRKTLALLLESGGDTTREALVIAGFRKYLRGVDDLGREFQVSEPHLSEADVDLLRSDDPLDALRAAPFAALDLAAHPDFVATYRQVVADLDGKGAAATVHEILQR
ncbi:mannitol dehydrogenase family protein [Nakamurella alba]|uniref:mannitol dehydrogenase family protein n=1 Tax=Nakamurella alba TaxID=2665158 RepID=UPI001E2C3709|nr:mannitol dehydrogenase family protein [Nakamurella alba]